MLLNHTYPVSQKDFGKYGAYVMQDDVLFPTLTCKEVITFSARLKLNLTGSELRQKVDEIIESLGLLKCKNTKIGSQTIKGLSGGERKRTAIGVEMITDPKILFLDEPTSGLDSFTAHKIVKLLVDQSRLGKTVIATIHQPSSNTFSLFDKLILLMDGNPIYQGKASQAANYFTSLGFKIPKFANPSDYFLKEFFVPFHRTIEDDLKLQKLIENYSDRILPQLLNSEEDHKDEDVESISSSTLSISPSRANFFIEFKEILIRATKNILREPTFIKMRCLQTLVLCVLSILIFYSLDHSQKGVSGKIGYFFFTSMNQTMIGMMSILLVFIVERPVFLREYASHTYGVNSYFLAKSLVESPLQVVFLVVEATGVYFFIGLTVEVERYLVFVLVV